MEGKKGEYGEGEEREESHLTMNNVRIHNLQRHSAVKITLGLVLARFL